MTAGPVYRITDEEIRTIEALETSHWFYRGMRETCFALMEPLLPSRRPLHVLDVGCGTGGNLVHLARFGTVEGLDASALAVEYCRRKGLTCTRGSMTDLSGVSGPFDLVTMFDAWHQAEPADTPAILSGIARILAPDGLLVFREPAMAMAAGAHDRAVGIQQRFTKRTVRAALAAAGLAPLRLTYLNTLLFPPIVLRRRIGELVAGRAHVASDVQSTAPALNALLLGILRAEGRLLRVMDLPFGVSIFGAATKSTKTV